MDIGGKIFILVLLLVSGLVAWAGDVLGRRLGKRRLALFRLRPRRTAVLVTIVTGMLITGLTILATYMASENVRYALDNMNRIRVERDRLVKERNDAWAASDTMRQTIQEGERAISLQRSTIDDLTGQLTIAETELGSMQEELGEISDQVKASQAEVNSLKAQRDQLVAQNAQMTQEMTAERAQKEAQIAGLNEQISERETRLAGLNSQIDELTSQIAAWSGGRVKVREGQQLAAFPVDTTLSIADLDRQVGPKLAAIKYNYRDPITGVAVLADNEMVIPTDAYMQALESIQAIPSEQAVVIAYASANVLENEAVALRIEVTTNYKLFPTGTVIFSKTIQESPQSADPYRAVMASFMEDAKNHLVDDRRIIPTGAGELIQLTIDDLVDLSNSLQSVGFPAEIGMVALKDIYRTDFLVYGDQFDVRISRANPAEPE